jgi:gluconokinase
MNQPYIIGIDIGTGSVKAIAMNNACEVITRAQRYYPSASGANTTEQDPLDVWETFNKCLEQVIELMQYAPVAVSLSAAMHSIFPVDDKGRPLTKAILWSDTRSSAIAKDLRESERGKTIFNATGTPVHAMSPLCKIGWLKEFEPSVFQSASKFISLKEFIWFNLFGEYKVDHSIASATGLFNIHSLQWEGEALAFAGIATHQLSQPVSTSYSRVLNIHKDIFWKPYYGTVFYIGASDGCLANLGSRALDSSVAVISLGTSAAVRVTVKQPVVQAEPIFFNYILDSQRFVCGGGINNGGNVIQWLLQNTLAGDPSINTYEDVFALISSVAPGSNGLICLPYLHGERAPVWDEESCGVYFGIRPVHNRAHFARAGVEGICFALHQILILLEAHCGPVDTVVVSGGLAQHGSMVQMLADITAKKIIRHHDDASLSGAAFLALKEMGILTDYTQIPVSGWEMVVPKKENKMVYREYFKVYRNLYPALKENMQLLQKLSNG